jgi:dTMP kinase
MTKPEFYGAGFPYKKIKDVQGKLIVLEGTDGVGRSSQIQLLRNWLEREGYAVSDTGMRRSPLTQPGLDAAKQGHMLSPLTMSLFYATDYADRLENQIIPAMKAGFIVLSDRYFYSIMARDIVRGADPEWSRKMYGFALKPDLVLYLKADISTLIKRIVHGRGFDFWEAGMDIRCSDNLFDSFVVYQSLLIDQLDQMAKEYNFTTIDANESIQRVFKDMSAKILHFLQNKQA